MGDHRACILLLATLLICIPVTHGADIEATCDLVADPSATQSLSGTVTFTQEDQATQVHVVIAIEGFDSADTVTKHGFHVHETGDITGGCAAAGGHFNPDGVNHADRLESPRHVGDLGNIEENAVGAVTTNFNDDVIQLKGAHSILERAIVVHELEDDLGLGSNNESLVTGNAGPRLACCVITEVTENGATRQTTLTLPFFISTAILVLYRLL